MTQEPRAALRRQVGFRAPDDVLTGRELEVMTDGELARRLDTVNVFARVIPEQKLRIVQALQGPGRGGRHDG